MQHANRGVNNPLCSTPSGLLYFLFVSPDFIGAIQVKALAFSKSIKVLLNQED
jgi:hypothetical protein